MIKKIYISTTAMLMLFIVSCSTGSPTDQMLEKLDDVVTTYEDKANGNKLSDEEIANFGIDIQEATKKLEEKYPELKNSKKEDFSAEQKKKMVDLTSRMSNLIGRSFSSPF